MEAIYAAQTVALAALEALVHFSVLPRDFVLTEIQIPAAVSIEFLDNARLSSDWQSFSRSSTTQALGRVWAIELRSAVLSVPSSHVPFDGVDHSEPYDAGK